MLRVYGLCCEYSLYCYGVCCESIVYVEFIVYVVSL